MPSNFRQCARGWYLETSETFPLRRKSDERTKTRHRWTIDHIHVHGNVYRGELAQRRVSSSGGYRRVSSRYSSAPPIYEVTATTNPDAGMRASIVAGRSFKSSGLEIDFTLSRS
jgi:hypothetical protein